MHEQRKKIILAEIKYWKQNNLLPEHYCDFLSALYAKGEGSQEGKVNSSVLHNESKKQRRTLLVLLLFGAGLAASIQFLQTDSALMIGAAGIFILLGYAAFKSVKHQVVLPSIYIVTALLLLLMSIKLWSMFFADNPMILTGLLILNCVTWLFAGRLLKLLYFTLSGTIGLICIIAFLVYQF